MQNPYDIILAVYLIVDFCNLSQFIVDISSYSIVFVRNRNIYIQFFIDCFYFCISLYIKYFIFYLIDIFLFKIILISYFADNLLKKVFYGNKTQSSSVFIYYNCHVILFFPEFLQKLYKSLCPRNKISISFQFAYLYIFIPCSVEF